MLKYPEDWEEIELGKKGKLLGGLTGKNKHDFINGNAKLITYKNVFANIFIDLKINDKVKINDNEKQNILEYGDVCFTGSSETFEESGMSSVLIEKPLERLFLNSFCFIYRFFDLNIIYPKFAMYYFRATDIRNKIISTSRGITRYNISKEEFKKIKIYLPPLKEQQAIADILTSFDEHIDNLIKLIEKKKNIRDGALEDLLNRKIRLNGFNDEWKYYKIHELFNVTAGGDLNKKYFSKTATSKNLYEVFSNGIDNQGIYGYTSHALYKGNSLTITARGTIGHVYYREKPFDAIIRLLVLIPKNDEINPKFYKYYINNKVKFELENTGVPQLTVPKVEEKDIPFMDRKEQDAIANILTVMDDGIISLEKELDKMKQIREGAMNDLLTGRVRLEI